MLAQISPQRTQIAPPLSEMACQQVSDPNWRITLPVYCQLRARNFFRCPYSKWCYGDLKYRIPMNKFPFPHQNTLSMCF